MEKLEPLLKEEEDKFYFIKNKEPKKNKLSDDKKSLIITSVLGVFILVFMWYCLYPFYVGFVNFEKGHVIDEELIEKKEEEVPVTSAVISDLNKYISVINNIESPSIFGIFYTDHEVGRDILDDRQKLELIFKYMGATCGSEITKSLDDIKNVSMMIFNSDSVIKEITNNNQVNGFSINYNEANNNYSIVANECEASNDFTFKKIVKASSFNDEIYIYEAIGYFVNVGDNKYEVYSDLSKKTKLGDYIDENGNKEFSEIDALKQYKWKFKKNNDNSYSLISVIPVI